MTPERPLRSYGPWMISVLVLAACGGSPAGQRGGAGGTGGVSLGADPAENFGGDGGLPVELSFLSFDVRSQLWAPGVDPGPALPRYTVILDERAGGCETYDAGWVGAGPHRLAVFLSAPAVGDCRLDAEVAEGCSFAVGVFPGQGRGLLPFPFQPATASLRIDRFDADALSGELRASFPLDPEIPSGWWSSTSGDSGVYCTGVTGTQRECRPSTPDEDCCNAGKPLEELVLAIDATFCRSAVSCGDDEHCAAVERALACPAPAVDCDAACAGFAGSCGSCTDCGDSELCQRVVAAQCAAALEECPAGCAAARGQRLAAVATACLAAGADCDGWNECLASCGAPR